MRTYKRKKTDIPSNIYLQMKSLLKDYDRLKAQKTSIEQSGSSPADGMPRGNTTGNPTQQKALLLASINDRLYAIEQSYIEVQGMYSDKTYDEFNPIKAFWDYGYFNYMHKRKLDNGDGPSYRTWGNFKYLFARLIANKLNYF